MTIDQREVFQKIAKLGHLESFKTNLFFGEKGGYPYSSPEFSEEEEGGEKLCEIFHTFFLKTYVIYHYALPLPGPDLH